MSSVPTSVDPRGLRLAATLTSLTLVVVIVAPTPFREALLAAQAAIFAVGAVRGPSATVWAHVFVRFVRPRLTAPADLEDSRPPQFAQAVGLAFTVPALGALLVGADVLGLVLVGFALVAALLNAVTGFCLGCELYLLTRRVAKQIA